MLDAYVAAGWRIIRIRSCDKRPIDKGYAEIPYTPADFVAGDNVGVLLGQPSGGLVDIDLDCAEAIALAPSLMPGPTATYGREGPCKTPTHAPGLPTGFVRHYLYVCPVATIKGLARAHVELRSTNIYSVVPPSIHESGAPITWSPNSPAPMRIDPVELTTAFAKLAAATIIARAWSGSGLDGNRHDLALALAGALHHAGWEPDAIEHLLVHAMEVGGERDMHARTDDVRSSLAGSDEAHRWGWPTVEKILGPADTTALQRAIEKVPSVPRSVIASTLEHGQLTDTGNAERFIAEHGENLRYTRGLGWLRWDGTRWASTGEPVAEIVATTRGLGKLATASGDAVLAKWATKSEDRSKIDACLSIASRMPGLALEPADLDADPLVLNVANGIVDLRTGALLPHDRLALCSKIAPVEYDPRAVAPRFSQFLVEVFAGDQTIALYVLRFLGYALTGLVRDQGFALWHGPKGGNGKTTLIELVRSIMGDYATSMSADTLLAHAGSQHPTSLMDLRGSRLVTTEEVDEGTRWNEALVNKLTGGGEIKARFCAKDNVKFMPTHKLLIAVNSRPLVRGQSGAFWRRVQVVPWTQSFVGREDTRLGETLATERAGVLALLVAGCLAWQRDGLAPPRVVADQVDEYRRSQDTIGQCLAELCELGGAVAISELFARYGHWASMRHEHVLPASAFARVLEERLGSSAVYRGQVRGLRLRGGSRS